eukprot:1143713-Pelagomonas_calceolata.AAC.8
MEHTHTHSHTHCNDPIYLLYGRRSEASTVLVAHVLIKQGGTGQAHSGAVYTPRASCTAAAGAAAAAAAQSLSQSDSHLGSWGTSGTAAAQVLLR